MYAHICMHGESKFGTKQIFGTLRDEYDTIFRLLKNKLRAAAFRVRAKRNLIDDPRL